MVCFLGGCCFFFSLSCPDLLFAETGKSQHCIQKKKKPLHIILSNHQFAWSETCCYGVCTPLSLPFASCEEKNSEFVARSLTDISLRTVSIQPVLCSIGKLWSSLLSGLCPIWLAWLKKWGYQSPCKNAQPWCVECLSQHRDRLPNAILTPNCPNGENTKISSTLEWVS